MTIDADIDRTSVPAVIGHTAFGADLAVARHSGRMHHAWLLTGPHGIGKASAAVEAAAWLMAENEPVTMFDDVPPAFEIDPHDPGTNLVFNGAHPDLMVIRPALEDNKSGQIKIDQIRGLVPFMMHKPGRGGWRVAIVDAMDQVNRNGANAMLKFLEEPPEKTVIFLICARPGRLPPTIRSRCRLVRMSALDPAACQSVLEGIWPEADATQIDLLTKLSEGAPGRAVMLAESGAADCYQAACAILSADRLDVPALASICGKWGQGSAAGKASRDGAIILLERLLRGAALFSATGQSALQNVTFCDFEKRVIDALCMRHSAETLASMQSKFSREAARAEGLYADFAHFLLRQITEFHRKSLP